MKLKKSFHICSRLAKLMRPLSGYMALAVLFGTLGHLCAAFLTLLGAYALLDLLEIAAPIALRAALIAVGACGVLRGVFHYAEQSLNHFIAFRLLALIRDQVFRALRRLCPAKLEGRDKGGLISLITSDIELLEVFYAHTVSPVLIALLTSVTLSLLIGQYHWLLGLLAAAAYLTVGIVIPSAAAKKSGDGGRRLRDLSGELSSHVLENLRGISEIMQYQAGEERLRAMNDSSDRLFAEQGRMNRLSARSRAVTHVVVLLFDLAMLALSSLLYLTGRCGFDGLLIPVVALMSSFGPVIALADLGTTLQSTLAAGSRVLEILDEEPAAAEISGQPAISFHGAKAEHLTFSYSSQLVLSDVSIRFPLHKTVGISGKSGSGKSTLLKLLMRFWAAPAGQVLISDTDIGRINTADLRAMEGFMTQDTYLFHDSIENNLRIVKPDATTAELEEACRKASVHDFITALPKGYQTEVGELGGTLSGGERQRIGLARAFLHDAPFLLLDEPTSNLDSLNESVILKSIGEESRDKTVILVSHRPSTMRIADTVYSVENGRMS